MKRKKYQNKEKNNSKKNKKGFTLIEVVLATLIVSVSFVSIYALISITHKSYIEGRYEVIAAGLAQEAVELVRNYRDEEALNNPSGFDVTDLINDCGSECVVYLDSNKEVQIVKNANANKQKVEQLTDGQYENCYTGNCAGKFPNFTRKVEMSNVPLTTSNAVRVKVTVEWDSFALGTTRKKVIVESILSNWLGN